MQRNSRNRVRGSAARQASEIHRAELHDAADTAATTDAHAMHRSLLRSVLADSGQERLMMRKRNRRSDQLSATNQVARELLLVTLENCRIDLPTWFAEFIRWHEPNGL